MSRSLKLEFAVYALLPFLGAAIVAVSGDVDIGGRGGFSPSWLGAAALPSEFPRPALDPRVLAHEGGYSNHPHDPGGRTLQGITQRVYDRDRIERGLESRLITDDLLVDPAWPAERDRIYQAKYWTPCRGADLPKGVGYALFDLCVNSGPARGGRLLRRALALDPHWRNQLDLDEAGWHVSDAIVRATRRNPARICADLNDVRMRFLAALSTFEPFGRGWTLRVNSVRAHCLAD